MTRWMIWNVCYSYYWFCNAIVFCPLFGTCTINEENIWCQKLASLYNYKSNQGARKYIKVALYLQIRPENLLRGA